MAENMLEITDENFSSEVLESDVPVLVDFWATWCGPCLQLAPVMEELAGDYAGRVVVGKVNIDEARSLAEQYNIASIPTVIIFKGGQVAKSFMGVAPKEQFAAALDEQLG